MSTFDPLETLLSGNNAGFIELQYSRFSKSPNAVDADWRRFFERMENGVAKTTGPSWRRTDWPPSGGIAEKKPAVAPPTVSQKDIRRATLDSLRVLMMIRSFRVRGHLMAHLDPLGLEERPSHPELEPGTYGFEKADFDRPIFLDHVLGLETGSINEILTILNRTYCSAVGVEFMHISEPAEKAWIQKRIEGRDKEIQFTPEGKKAILQKLVEAEQFEKFLGKKFVGTKRFGLDGGEAMIPALEGVIKTGGAKGVEEIVIGMAHRGRLNVLTNVMKKPFRAIFHEFHGGSYKPDDVQGSGDVKYHLGASTYREFDGNRVYLSLSANPSHLEAVDPVVLGRTRAKQMLGGDTEDKRVMSLLIHGDAAFAGQGIVAECFMLSGLKGYRTGGTLHFIINNQIGFTTSPHHSRSSPYPSDSAKIVQAPIFHVNGDDPEAVVYVAKMATEFRQTFKKDVVIDMVCYRRFGHNESDEPSFTQPKMYAAIKNHPTTQDIYNERLVTEGTVSSDDLGTMKKDFTQNLDKEMKTAATYKPEADRFEGRWRGLHERDGKIGFIKTGVPKKVFLEIGKTLTKIPEDFQIHRTLNRFLQAREKMFETGQGFDWATAEALALGALLYENYSVRLAGQDTIRGTFSQRHADFIDQVSEKHFRPLSNIKTNAQLEIIDSPLSETGVLGFEYGFSQADPTTLVLWEAQFGDFANVAQVVIDQFISSAEAKWQRSSGLVMLLPHGFEGQGPEHSSARLERFLQMCAEKNMQVANCSTPANYFHILRRQMLREFRKPLIIMTPKSLLRHKAAVSALDEFTTGTGFNHILKDSSKILKDKAIKRVIMCTGKVYYDILDARDKRGLKDTYIFRVEQLYPFPRNLIGKELKRFPGLKLVVWCQEEPQNMGAWSFIEPRIEQVLTGVGQKAVTRAQYAGRKAAASPATGLASTHEKEQAELVDLALTL
ncbi:MAG: 2-oxoglutarate dehydrogenase E1 component [Alphaproteobacteria bacterium]